MGNGGEARRDQRMEALQQDELQAARPDLSRSDQRRDRDGRGR